MYEGIHQAQSGVEQSGADGRTAPFAGRQLIVVSNRQPYRHEPGDAGDGVSVDRPTGGLTASLDPVMQRTGGTWIAWGDGDADRDVVDASDRVAVPPDDPAYTLRRVWLTDDQVEDYYYGFSNQVLWPLCHSALATVESEQSFWEAYQQTNEQFAETVVEEAGQEPLVWFQDYHFALAPRRVRQRLGHDAILMQFWHIPWPEPEVFDACPHGEALLRGLLGNEALAFHVGRYRDHFLECVDTMLDGVSVNWQSGDVTHGEGTTRVVAIPMGVPVDDIRRTAAAYDASDFTAFRESYGIDADTKIAVGVDRLDYSKGILERLRALEHLWESRPAWRGSLTFVQNGSESRSTIDAYERLQDRVSARIDRINRRFGTDDWQPVISVSEYLSKAELYGLYRHSEAGIVSSIRDGLNLVAQEYAAAQVEGDGVLLLSDQTGSHDMIGEYAVSVSPFDVEQFSQRLADALTMPMAERQTRMKRIRQTITDHDLQHWLDQNAHLARGVQQARDTRLTHDQF